jgi:hypothetical protein
VPRGLARHTGRYRPRRAQAIASEAVSSASGSTGLDLIDTAVGIGNCHGADDVNKFHQFGLTPKRATKVALTVSSRNLTSGRVRRGRRSVRQYQARGIGSW